MVQKVSVPIRGAPDPADETGILRKRLEKRMKSWSNNHFWMPIFVGVD